MVERKKYQELRITEEQINGREEKQVMKNRQNHRLESTKRRYTLQKITEELKKHRTG